MRRIAAGAALLALGAACAAAAEDDLAWTVEMMARVGFAQAPSFSPDGARVAYLTNLSGVPQVWIVPVEGGYPRQVTASEDPVTALAWSPSGDWIAFQLAPGGGLNSQIYVVRPDGTRPRLLTAGGQVNNWLGAWTRDGRAMAISSNRLGADGMDAFLLSPGGDHSLVARNPGVGSLLDTSPDGTRGLLTRMVSRGSNDLYLIDLASSRETLLTPHEGPGEFEGVLDPASGAVYLSTNLTTDRAALGRVAVTGAGAGGIEVLLAREDAELDGLAIDEAGRRLALLWNAGGRSELGIYDVAAGRESRVTDLPCEIVSGVTFSRDGSRIAFSGGGAAAPMDAWIYEVGAGAFHRLTTSPHAGVSLEDLVRPELVRYRAHDGLELSGWIYRTKRAAAPGPVVVNFHGGPEGQARPFFNSTFQALLLRGISVFDANVRGSSGFGKRFVNLDNGSRRTDAVRDIKSTVEHLVRSGVADAKRIGVMGGSYGGYMVMAGLSEYPDAFAAGVDLFGVVNFETFFRHTQPWMAAISTVEYGDPKTEAELLRRLSPIHRVDRVVAPTLVLHGANDTNVPVVEAEQVADSLKKRGVPVKYVLFPDEGHGWRKTKNRVTSTVEIVTWFTTHLGVGAN